MRRLAREKGVDLSGVRGSGEHGRIEPGDLDSAPAAKVAEKVPDTKPGEDRNAKPSGEPKAATTASPAPLARIGLAEPESRPLSPMRKTIARRLTQAKQTVPHFYLTIDVEVSELVKLRETINADLAAHAKPAKPGAEPVKPREDQPQ